jgi:ferric-dicitrate binding protein FerR (iron transport regulator)
MLQDDYTSLIHKSLTGQISRQENIQLQQWLQDSAEHRREYDEIKKIWEMDVDDTSPDEYDHAFNLKRLEENLTLLVSKEIQVRRLKRLVILALSMCVGVMAGSAYLYLYLYPPVRLEERYTVAASDSSTVWLSDSSRVDLNSTSRLGCQFTRKERVIDLEGEALLSVKKEERPFILRSPAGTIRVKGTTFHVRAFYDRPLEVTVIDGRVDVCLPAMTWHLHRGEYLSLKDGLRSKAVPADDSSMQFWLTGKLEFKKASLEEVIRQVEKLYSIRCTLPVALRGCPFTGTFDQASVEEIIKILSYSINIEFHATGRGSYSVSGKGCTL